MTNRIGNLNRPYYTRHRYVHTYITYICTYSTFCTCCTRALHCTLSCTPPRMLAFCSIVQNRIIVQQMCEDAFNKTKLRVAKNTNNVCTAQTLMGTTIDVGVIGKTHHYEAVSRDSELGSRCPPVDRNLFEPIFRPAKMEPALRDLNIKSIVGYGQPSWYSAGTGNMMAPVLDLMVTQDALSAGNLELISSSWLCRLARAKLLIRKFGAADWMLSLGDIGSTSTLSWPTIAVGNGDYAIDTAPGTEGKFLSIFECTGWEAMTIQASAPLDQAFVCCTCDLMLDNIYYLYILIYLYLFVYVFINLIYLYILAYIYIYINI